MDFTLTYDLKIIVVGWDYMSSRFLKGAFILTLGSIISKVLGLFYVIPFEEMVGPTGGALYAHGYNLYSIFISFATAGMPLAISKFVSKYNAIEEYAVGRKLFKASMFLMLITGFIAFFILYSIAPIYANLVNDSTGNITNQDITTVIRAVSFALILIPFMSIVRGFFQGHEDMKPTAISQVVEQIVRIVFLLAGVFVIYKIFNRELVEAISIATFAATVGALGGLVVLAVYWRKRRKNLQNLMKKDLGTVQISLPKIFKEVLLSSIPFVFVGIALPVFQQVDLMTFVRAMQQAGVNIETAEESLGVLTLFAQKIVIIPMTLATGFSMALIPSVTKAYMMENEAQLKHNLDLAFQVLLFITVPAVVGMSLLADPIYTVFYSYNPIGGMVLRDYAPTAVLFALFSITAAILQGINQQKFTVLSLLVGFLLKLALNIPLIRIYETSGAIYATSIGFLTAVLMNLAFIKYFTKYSYHLVFCRTILISIFTGLMALLVWGMESGLLLFLSPEHKWQALKIVIVCSGIGALFYVVISLKSKLAHRLFGSKIDTLQRKLKLKD